MPVLPPIVQSLLLLLAPFALLLLEGNKMRQIPLLLGINFKNLKRQLISGFKLFLLTFVALILQAITLAFFGVADSQKVAAIIAQQTFLTLIAIVLVAPIAEELLFRGYVQKKIASVAPGKHAEKIGVLLSAIVFSLLHAGFGSVSELAGAFTAAIIFGLYVSKNKAIIPVIVAHALVNVYAVVVSLALKK